jgi:hypothetical protein
MVAALIEVTRVPLHLQDWSKRHWCPGGQSTLGNKMPEGEG